MPFISFAFTSEAGEGPLHLVRSGRPSRPRAAGADAEPLSTLTAGARGTIAEVRGIRGTCADRVDRLLALGVTPGASITVLQTFPGIVFLCDQTELAIEREVAGVIFVSLSKE